MGGNAWRKEAGGCSECGASLDQCVATCIQSALVPSSAFGPFAKKNYTKLRQVWEKAFSDKDFCPDQPFPADATSSLPWPPHAPPPNKTVTTYHLFQPKYTGLANKDAGDFLGDAS